MNDLQKAQERQRIVDGYRQVGDDEAADKIESMDDQEFKSHQEYVKQVNDIYREYRGKSEAELDAELDALIDENLRDRAAQDRLYREQAKSIPVSEKIRHLGEEKRRKQYVAKHGQPGILQGPYSGKQVGRIFGGII